MQLTNALAIYGACVSTGTAIWNYSRSKAQVRVILIFAIENTQGESQIGLGISVQNVSSQAVHLTNISLLLPFRKVSLRQKIGHFFQYRRIVRNDG